MVFSGDGIASKKLEFIAHKDKKRKILDGG
jgi:hypothetical protein